MDYKMPRGTIDFLPEDTLKRDLVATLLKSIATDFGYREIETPMFENLEVFSRSSGEGSDIVTKEMYVFKDRGDRTLALRPEGTAGVVRAFVEHKLYATVELPYKVFYLQPAFRYERPQAGRYRQHTQFGLESIGAGLVENDAELLLQIFHMFSELGVGDFYFKINTLGDAAARQKYVEVLKDYFKPHLDELCEDCHNRYEKNPLRILDCKVDGDKPFFKQAPQITDYVSAESKERFQKLCDYLEDYQVPYVIDPGLVRGLDYYSETVFEIYIKGKEKEYGAIGAGGRYNDLVKELGGPELPCVGFASGLERLVSVLEEQHAFDNVDDGLMAYVMPLDKSVFSYAFNVAMHLRFNQIPTEMDYGCRSLKAQFKSVDKKKAKFAILIGSNEMLASSVTVKNNATKTQEVVRVDQLVDYLMNAIIEMQEKAEHHDEHCKCGCHHEGHEHSEECECGCHDGKHEHSDECECDCHKEGHEHDENCECGCHDGEHQHSDECKCGCHNDKKKKA